MLGARLQGLRYWLARLLLRLGWFYLVGILIAALALLAFGALAEEVLRGQVQDLNVAVLEWLHSYANPGLDGLALSLTYLGGTEGTTLMGALVTVVLLWVRRPLDAATLLLVLLGGSVLLVVLKHAFHMPRPDLFDSLAHRPHTYSFPSGHTLLSVCLYGYLGALLILVGPRRVWRWAAAASLLLLALGIGWSRLYLGVHWFSDVVAGTLVGVFWVCCCLMARQLAQAHFDRRAAWRSLSSPTPADSGDGRQAAGGEGGESDPHGSPRDTSLFS